MNPNKILALIALIPSLSMANQALLVPDGKWIKTSDNNEKIVISTNQKQVTFGDNKCPWAKSASETMKSDCVAVKQEPLEKSSIQNNLNQLEKSITEGVRKKLYDRQTAADLKKLAEKNRKVLQSIPENKKFPKFTIHWKDDDGGDCEQSYFAVNNEMYNEGSCFGGGYYSYWLTALNKTE